MVKSIIKKYKLPDNFDDNFFLLFEAREEDFDGELREVGFTYMGADYIDFDGKTASFYLHHDSGTSLMINTDYEELYLFELENYIDKAKKDLESLIGKLKYLGEVDAVR